MKPKTLKDNEITLFLIEDDDIDALAIERGLKQNNISNQVIRAYDGQEAYKLLENNHVSPPFVILLDLQMPRLNGIEFLKKIRKNEKHKDSVVFVLTTSTSQTDLMECYSEQVAGYFIKDRLGDNFSELIYMLKSYWNIVILPTK